jgi:hypothetical protein
MLSICFIHVLHFWFFNFKDCFQLVFHGFLLQLVCVLMVDTWVKLHTRMSAAIPGFPRIPIACKWKFNAIYKQYKDDKIANGILGNDCHECPFYDVLDSCWHWNGNVMKNVSVFGNEIKKIISSLDFKHILMMFQMMKVMRNQWRNLWP